MEWLGNDGKYWVNLSKRHNNVLFDLTLTQTTKRIPFVKGFLRDTILTFMRE